LSFKIDILLIAADSSAGSLKKKIFFKWKLTTSLYSFRCQERTIK